MSASQHFWARKLPGTNRRARGGAARAENALVHAVELLAVVLGLEDLSLGGVVVLEPRLDGLVLLVEEGEVRDEVLDNVHCKTSAESCRTRPEKRTVREGVDLAGLGGVLVNAAETGEGVDTVNVHGTRATDTLTARATEGKGGVHLVLDLELKG